MYAVLKTGGKQYRVTEGQTICVEKLTANVDENVEFATVLMVKSGDTLKIGAPFVTGAKVSGKVVEQGRHKKIRIIKFRRRKHYDRQAGHRQDYTAIKIEKISA